MALPTLNNRLFDFVYINENGNFFLNLRVKKIYFGIYSNTNNNNNTIFLKHPIIGLISLVYVFRAYLFKKCLKKA